MQNDTPVDGSPQNNSWSYTPEESNIPDAPAAQTDVEPISWTGSEFIDRQKSGGWYMSLAGGIIFLSVVIWFTIHDWIAIIAIVLSGILFGIVAGRAPKQRSFSIDNQGITVDAKFFSYNEFRSFNLLRDGAMGYIELVPLKRFMPEISLYFAPDDEQRIFNTLASFLPHEERTEHKVDRLMRKLKF